jgi:hypothetical protein
MPGDSSSAQGDGRHRKRILANGVSIFSTPSAKQKDGYEFPAKTLPSR